MSGWLAGRTPVRGTRHLVAAAHDLAARAGLEMLEAGGNAVDAGVAAVLALGVVESEQVSIAGVAPMLVYLAERDEMHAVSGLGGWPKAASAAYFRERHGGAIPLGLLRSVVPGAPDACVTALERFGTMGFGDVAAPAIHLARDGFPMYPLMADRLAADAPILSGWPSSAAVYLPGGRVPRPGEVFVQSDLAATLQFLADEDAAQARRGRKKGLQAVREAFYQGDLAAAIVQFQRQNGGLLAAEDLAGFRVDVEPPVGVRFGEADVHTGGPWCQGPMLLQSLNLLEGFDLAAMGHNTVSTIHTVVEAIKLAAADREAYYGDPKFVEVPMAGLLAKAYAEERRTLIRPGAAWPGMPPPGTIAGRAERRHPQQARPEAPPAGPGAADRLDTSTVCVVDRHGNAFSASPSDSCAQAPVTPGTGFVVSPRGAQSWTDPGHPACIAPGKRPRLTPAPALVRTGDGRLMPFGTPGGDTQTQVMAQVFLNVFVFGMDPQSAVEAPRFVTYSFPASSEPHDDYPGRLYLEGAIGDDIADRLKALGHEVLRWEGGSPVTTGPDVPAPCAILADRARGVLTGGADPRRPSGVAGR